MPRVCQSCSRFLEALNVKVKMSSREVLKVFNETSLREALEVFEMSSKEALQVFNEVSSGKASKICEIFSKKARNDLVHSHDRYFLSVRGL